MSASPPTVLFLCVANSARSQMAEGLARRHFGDRVRVLSAGSKPTQVNPWAITAMEEIDIDITKQRSKSVHAIATDAVDLVITLCADEVCPAFLGQAKQLHWPLSDPDPKTLVLEDQEILERFREARDAIADRLVHAFPDGRFAPEEIS